MRPVIRYHGGKWTSAPWIISHFPKHKYYVEPYGGAASVLIRKPKSVGEIYNDLDRKIVNVFRILRDPIESKKLLRLIELTPYARDEFNLSFEKTNEDLEQARRTIVRSFMGYSSDATTRNYRTGFRNSNYGSGTFASKDWANYPWGLEQAIKRLKSVVIENMPALEVINKYDSKETLFYVDPPYLPETRFKGSKCYRFEMTEEEHIELSIKLKDLEGMVIVSGYHSELYDKLYKNWHREEKKICGQAGNGKGSKMNTEILWISPNTQKILKLF